MSAGDVPRDPLTGRALLGGRARRVADPARHHRRFLIALQGATVIHLGDLRSTVVRPLCGTIGHDEPATADRDRPTCRQCVRIGRQRGWWT